MSTPKEDVLIVTDDTETLERYKTYLAPLKNINVVEAPSGAYGIGYMHTLNPSCILLDHQLRDIKSTDFITKGRETSESDCTPVIVINREDNADTAVEMMKHGAFDYLSQKNLDADALMQSVEATIAAFKAKTDAKYAEEKIYHLAHHDSLTQLPNRLFFKETLKHTLHHAAGQYVGLMFIDLDHFKAVNDSLGHHLGDRVLKEASKHLTNSIRASDFLARIAGDEFAIILPNIESTQIPATIAQHIIDAFSSPMKISGKQVQIGASIGIACYPTAGQDHVSLLKSADAAMYRAKQVGRNNYQFFSESLNIEHQEKMRIQKALRYAITDIPFTIEWRTCTGIDEAKITALYPTLSWTDEILGDVPEAIFMQSLEQLGLSEPIFNWMLKQAMTQYKGTPLIVPIPDTLCHSGTFQESLLQRAASNSLPVYFSIKQSSANKMPEEVLGFMLKCESLGLKIILQDFGSGLCSLTHLACMPISALLLAEGKQQKNRATQLYRDIGISLGIETWQVKC